MAARLLVAEGHDVTLHARNDMRAADAHRAPPKAEAVVVGDLSSVAEMRRVGGAVNALGRYDAVIHNVGMGYRDLDGSRPSISSRRSSRLTCSRRIFVRR
jgi:NAD(P)-dependent dehydrogenase (short-subunit alcohol dehydrogenase family)